MRTKNVFWLELVGFVVLFFCYGLARFRLGIDLTDEGAYLAWPLRVSLGEAPFSSELLTLIRPVEVYLSVLFNLHPAMTLYEFRMIGWTIHLVSFSTLAFFLFLLSHAPLRSLLVASVPLFVCQIFGLAAPSYNTLSSDFLLLALSLWGIASLAQGGRLMFGATGGAALFIATFAHPGLGLVAAAMLGRELWVGGLLSNCRHGRLTALNLGIAVFLVCWLVFLGYFCASGTFTHWHQRMAFSRAVTTFDQSYLNFLLGLLTYPFSYSKLAIILASTVLLVAGTAIIVSRFTREENSAASRILLSLVLITALILTFSFEGRFVPICFVMVSLVVAAMSFLPPPPGLPSGPGIRFLILVSCLAALTYASLTYYFTLERSWIAGTQGLSFAFSTGLLLLTNLPARRQAVLNLLLPATLTMAVICVAREHYRNVYRDDAPVALSADFNIPKLRQIKSTAERVRVLEELYAYLHPNIKPGDTLLAFDGCPMLYYVFDAQPAYGLAWAVRYGQSPATLAKLNEEFKAKPLPRYAVRNLVDLSRAAWSTARRLNYNDYPLNETVMANYQLERTIFPFEIWRLKSAGPGAPPHE